MVRVRQVVLTSLSVWYEMSLYLIGGQLERQGGYIALGTVPGSVGVNCYQCHTFLAFSLHRSLFILDLSMSLDVLLRCWTISG